MITIKDVEHVAKLARLELTEEEKQKMIKIFQNRIEKEQTEINYLKKRILEVRAEYLKTR